MVEEQREEGNTQEEHAVNFENITPDGAVAIRVLRRGEGECPPKHARCLGEVAGHPWHDAAMARRWPTTGS